MARNGNGASTATRSIGELVSELFREMSTLLQEELALARTEMSVKLPAVGRAAGMIAGGAALAYAGVLAIVAAVIIGLHAVLPWWAAALLVGLVVVGVGYFLIQTGMQTIKQINLAPRRTIASFQGYREVARPTGAAYTRQS